MNPWVKEDTPEMFDSLPSDRQELLLSWISSNLLQKKGFNEKHSSYGLKHLVKFNENENSYFYNGEFKGAMLKSGYSVKDKSKQNWYFNISERSPCFKR